MSLSRCNTLLYHVPRNIIRSEILQGRLPNDLAKWNATYFSNQHIYLMNITQTCNIVLNILLTKVNISQRKGLV